MSRGTDFGGYRRRSRPTIDSLDQQSRMRRQVGMGRGRGRGQIDQGTAPREEQYYSDMSKHVPDLSVIPYIRGFNKTGHLQEEAEREEVDNEDEYAGLAYFKNFMKSNGNYVGCLDEIIKPSEDEIEEHEDFIPSLESTEIPETFESGELFSADVGDLSNLMDHLERHYSGDTFIRKFTKAWKKHVSDRTLAIAEKKISVLDVYTATKNATKAGMQFVSEATAPVMRGMEGTISKLADTARASKSSIKRIREKLELQSRELQDVYNGLNACLMSKEGKSAPELVREMVQDASDQVGDVTRVSQSLKQETDRLAVENIHGMEDASAELHGTVEEGVDNMGDMIDTAEALAEQASVPPPYLPRDPQPGMVSEEATAGIADAMAEEGNTLAQQLQARRRQMNMDLVESEAGESEHLQRGPSTEEEWEDTAAKIRSPVTSKTEKDEIEKPVQQASKSKSKSKSKTARPSYAELMRKRRQDASVPLVKSAEKVNDDEMPDLVDRSDGDETILDDDIHIALKISDEERKESDDDDDLSSSEDSGSAGMDASLGKGFTDTSDEYW